MKKIDKIPEDAILVTGDVIVLYPSIPHKEGLDALKEKLKEKPSPKIPPNDLIKLAEFVLKDNVLEFHDKVKQQISGTAIDSKFALYMHVLISIKQKQIFLRPKIFGHSYGFIYWRYSFYIDARRKITK